MTDDVPSLSEDRFAKMFEKKNAAGNRSVDGKRRAEAKSIVAEDGRKRRAEVDGVQLNTRQTADLKNEVLDESRRTGLTMSEIVEAALRMYFQSKRS